MTPWKQKGSGVVHQAEFEVGILTFTSPTFPMRKFLLLSLLLSMVAVPLLSGGRSSAARALKRTFLIIILFNLFFLLALSFIYPHVQ